MSITDQSIGFIPYLMKKYAMKSIFRVMSNCMRKVDYSEFVFFSDSTFIVAKFDCIMRTEEAKIQNSRANLNLTTKLKKKSYLKRKKLSSSTSRSLLTIRKYENYSPWAYEDSQQCTVRPKSPERRRSKSAAHRGIYLQRGSFPPHIYISSSSELVQLLICYNV